MRIQKDYIFTPNFDLNNLKKGQRINLISDDLDEPELCIQRDLKEVSRLRVKRIINDLCLFRCSGSLGVPLSRVRSFRELRARLFKNIESRMFLKKYIFIDKIYQMYIFRSEDFEKTNYLVVSRDNSFCNPPGVLDFFTSDFSSPDGKELTTEELTDFLKVHFLK